MKTFKKLFKKSKGKVKMRKTYLILIATMAMAFVSASPVYGARRLMAERRGPSQALSSARITTQAVKGSPITI